MKLNFESIINSRIGVGAALILGRLLPPGLGYRLANTFADRITAKPGSPQVRALRANLWVATGCTLTGDELDDIVRKAYRHTAVCAYNLYHFRSNPEKMLKLAAFTSEVDRFIQERKDAKQGLVIVGIHLSNFDFVAQLGAMRGLQALALSAPNPTGDYEWVNKLRNRAGWEVIPASMASLKLAIKRLRRGGTVMSGIDRPFPESGYHPRFFGRPAALPVLHIQMALLSDCPLVVMAAIYKPDGLYHILASDYIYPEHLPDRRKELVYNAEIVLKVAEGFIKQAPDQWSMLHPVWPEVLNEVP